MAIDPERLAELFDAALERAGAERDAFVAQACAGDLALQSAVTALLHSDAAAPPGFLTTPPSLPPEPPPLRVGRFVLQRSLGVGGMGEVFAATDPVLGRTVAVKLLHARSPLARELLLREGQVLARLSHPNIVQLHDTGEHEGQVYLAMEHVDGVTLRTWLIRQPTSWRVRLPPLLEAARGLAAAHEVGLVHGDVKPENVLVGADGRVRLVDFGLARVQGGGDPALLAGLGTPAYLSPEQRRGAPQDPRSDQYSFCVMAYQCLFGQEPFDSLAAPAAPRPPPPDREVPPAIAAALRRGLADDPAARFPAMPALIAELARPLADDPEADLSIASRSRRALLAGFALLVAAIDVFVHLRGFDDVAPTAAGLVWIGLVALLAAILVVALAWSRLRTRINRLIATALVLQVAALLAHRLLGARLGQAPADILAVDLLLLGTCSGVGGLLAQTWLFGPCALFLVGALAAAIDLRAGPLAMSLASWCSLIFALVHLRPRP